jgi:hypothetical protein
VVDSNTGEGDVVELHGALGGMIANGQSTTSFVQNSLVLDFDGGRGTIRTLACLLMAIACQLRPPRGMRQLRTKLPITRRAVARLDLASSRDSCASGYAFHVSP